MILIDFARYYVIAIGQGNDEAAMKIRGVLLWLLQGGGR